MNRLWPLWGIVIVSIFSISCGEEKTSGPTSEPAMSTSWSCSSEPALCDDVPSGQSCPATCEESDWTSGDCIEGTGVRQELQGRMHISQPDEITYAQEPPATGDHRPMWACWGEYSFLPATRWLHNLEHGGIAFLYNPCAPDDIVEELRAYARAYPDDETGPFRWVMTPHANLPSTIAVVAWEWVYQANCVRPSEIDEFIRQHYRQAPEDIASPGSFSNGYISP